MKSPQDKLRRSLLRMGFPFSWLLSCAFATQLTGCGARQERTHQKSVEAGFVDEVSIAFDWPELHPCQRRRTITLGGTEGNTSQREVVPAAWVPLVLKYRPNNETRTLFLVWALSGGLGREAFARGFHLERPSPEEEPPKCEGVRSSLHQGSQTASDLNRLIQHLLGEMILPSALVVWNAPSTYGKTIPGVGHQYRALEDAIPSSWLNQLDQPWFENLPDRMQLASDKEDETLATLRGWEEQWKPTVTKLEHRLRAYALIRHYIDLRRAQLPKTWRGKTPPAQLSQAEYAGMWMLAELKANYSAPKYRRWLESIGKFDGKHFSIGKSFESTCVGFSPPFKGVLLPTRGSLDGPAPILEEEFAAFCRGYQSNLGLRFTTKGSDSANEVRSLATASSTGYLQDYFDPSRTPKKYPWHISQGHWALGTQVTPVFDGHVAIQPPEPIQCRSGGAYVGGAEDSPPCYRTHIAFFDPGTSAHRGSHPDLVLHIDVQYDRKPNPGTDNPVSPDDLAGNFFIAYPSHLNPNNHCPQTFNAPPPGEHPNLAECVVQRHTMNEAIDDVVTLLGIHRGLPTSDVTDSSSETNVLKLLLASNQYRRR